MKTARTEADRLNDIITIRVPLLLCLVVSLGFGSCLRPRDAFIIKIGGKREYRQVQLIPPASEEKRPPIRLKFIDTNTFQTTATISPGNYILTVASGDGMFLSHPLKVEPDKLYYEIPEIQPKSVPVLEGPEVSGQILVASGEMPRDLIVVFVGNDVIVRRTPVEGGHFRLHAPDAGSYRIEVIAPGNPPRVHVRDYEKLAGPLNMGSISLR